MMCEVIRVYVLNIAIKVYVSNDGSEGEDIDDPDDVGFLLLFSIVYVMVGVRQRWLGVWEAWFFY